MTSLVWWKITSYVESIETLFLVSFGEYRWIITLHSDMGDVDRNASLQKYVYYDKFNTT